MSLIKAVEVFADPDLAGLEPVWRQVLSQDPDATVFQTWEWNSAWWRILRAGARAHVMVAHGQDGPLAIAPVAIRRAAGGAFRCVHFLGAGVSDYLGFIGAPETLPQCVRAFVAALLETRAWHLIDLQQLSPAHAARAGLGEGLLPACSGAPPAEARWSAQDVCPVMPLPETWEEAMRRVGKKTRSNIGYYERLLRRDFEVSIGAAAGDDVPVALEEFFCLHARRWRRRGLPGALYSRRLLDFHRAVAPELARSGHLALHRLRLNGKTAAALYCFQFRSRAFYYLGGFEPALARYSPGTVLTAHAIRAAISGGCTEFDFLRGREPYKYRWPVEERTNCRLVIPRRGSSRSRLALRWSAWQQRALSAARTVLQGA
ncbi:MAG: GNAT family N-acetyltransferase [Armatimonadetes bacterium]|nr:GNAT family N-acetyltransferase [Armatimonadota bacterium]